MCGEGGVRVPVGLWDGEHVTGGCDITQTSRVRPALNCIVRVSPWMSSGARTEEIWR